MNPLAEQTSSSATPLRISGVCERDIDLLLMEELWASPEFATWLIAHATRHADGAVLVSLRRSATEFTGESDLEVDWRDKDGQVHRLLIENKVDAAFQHDQAARYRQRANQHQVSGVVHTSTTVIVAPLSYFGNDPSTKGFDVRISYEAIREWFSQAAIGLRADYKIAMFSAAIEKSRLGYQMVESTSATDFWQKYYEMARREAPELGMREPVGGRPDGSYFIFLAPSGLPKGVFLIHKLTNGAKRHTGSVDLQLDRCGERAMDVDRLLRPVLWEGMQVHRTGKSCVVRLLVPEVRMVHNFSEQEAQVRSGMRAASQLVDWVNQNRELLLATLLETRG